MHEVSLCESILKIITRQAEKDGFTRALKISLTIGDLSGASIEALEFCFPLVAKGTLAEGAALLFIPTQGSDLRVSSLEVD